MKKNWKMIGIVVLLAMVIIGIFANWTNASEEKVEEKPEGKVVHITVWLTEKNGKNWDDARTEIEEIIAEEYESFEAQEMHIHCDEERVYWTELTYETERGTVTGRIYDHR